MRKKRIMLAVMCMMLFLSLSGCAQYEVPPFDNFDPQNPIRSSRSYRKEAVRGLKNILARHQNHATLQAANSQRGATIVMLYKNDTPVCRLYLGEDWIGFQSCDPLNMDWTQAIYENPMDAEDRRVIMILLRH